MKFKEKLKSKLTKKNVILTAFIVGMIILLCFGISYVITSMLLNGLFVVVLDFAIFTNSTFWAIGGIGCLVFFIFAIGFSIYYDLFNYNKLLNKTEDAKSNVYGDSRMLTDKELTAKYGYYNFEELPNIEVSGNIVQSSYSHGKLNVMLVPKQHALVSGVSGDGKSLRHLGVTIQANGKSKVKPSMYINDIKGELWNMHSKFLQEQGYNTILIDLKNPYNSFRINPLDIIWELKEKEENTVLELSEEEVNAMYADYLLFKGELPKEDFIKRYYKDNIPADAAQINSDYNAVMQTIRKQTNLKDYPELLKQEPLCRFIDLPLNKNGKVDDIKLYHLFIDKYKFYMLYTIPIYDDEHYDEEDLTTVKKDRLYTEWQQRQATKKRDYDNRISGLIQSYANIIIPEGTGENKMWSDGARGVLMAIIVAMLEDGFTPYLNFTREMFTITQVSNIVNRQGSKLMEWLKTRPLSSKVYDYAGSILDNPAEKTVAGYMSNLKTPLTRYLENGIEYIMSGTDLNFDDIIAKPTAIFILVPEEFPARSTIASMLIVQLYNELLHQSNDFAELNFALPRPFYFFWDEFGNSVKISELSSWITLCRSRNIFFTLYVQALSQITKLYGNDDTKTIVQNCHLQIIMGSNEDDTIEHFRKLFGERTIISRTANFDPKTSDIDFKGSSTLQKVDLVPSSFLRKIPTGDIYWKIHKQNPAHTHLVAIFEDGVKDILKIGVYDKPAELYHHYDRAKLIYDLDNRHALYQNQKQNEMLADMMEQPTENIQQTTEETQNSEQPTTNDNLSSENMLNVFDDDFIPDGWEIASPEQLGEYNSAQEKAAQEIIDSEEEVESRENGSKPLVPNNARRSVLGSRK